MGTMERLMGEWGADFERWKELDPKVAEIAEIFEMMIADVKVTFTEDTMTTEGMGGGNAKVDTYKVVSDDGNEVVIEQYRGERKAVAAIEVVDDEHIVYRLREPKEDMLVLKR